MAEIDSSAPERLPPPLPPSESTIHVAADREEERLCRFCRCTEPEEELISPCDCKGTLTYIHENCLRRWVKTKPSTVPKCELCGYEYRIVYNTPHKKLWAFLFSPEQAPEEVKLVWLLVLYISMIIAWSYTTTLRSTVLLYAIFVAVTVFALRDTRRHWNDYPRPLHLVAHAPIFYMFTLISSTYIVLFIRWRKSDMSFWEFHYPGCSNICSWTANQTPILEMHQWLQVLLLLLPFNTWSQLQNPLPIIRRAIVNFLTSNQPVTLLDALQAMSDVTRGLLILICTGLFACFLYISPSLVWWMFWLVLLDIFVALVFAFVLNKINQEDRGSATISAATTSLCYSVITTLGTLELLLFPREWIVLMHGMYMRPTNTTTIATEQAAMASLSDAATVAEPVKELPFNMFQDAHQYGAFSFFCIAIPVTIVALLIATVLVLEKAAEDIGNNFRAWRQQYYQLHAAVPAADNAASNTDAADQSNIADVNVAAEVASMGSLWKDTCLYLFGMNSPMLIRCGRWAVVYVLLSVGFYVVPPEGVYPTVIFCSFVAVLLLHIGPVMVHWYRIGMPEGAHADWMLEDIARHDTLWVGLLALMHPLVVLAGQICILIFWRGHAMVFGYDPESYNEPAFNSMLTLAIGLVALGVSTLLCVAAITLVSSYQTWVKTGSGEIRILNKQPPTLGLPAPTVSAVESEHAGNAIADQ